jgi:hypothetical protein
MFPSTHSSSLELGRAAAPNGLREVVFSGRTANFGTTVSEILTEAREIAPIVPVAAAAERVAPQGPDHPNPRQLQSSGRSSFELLCGTSVDPLQATHHGC